MDFSDGLKLLVIVLPLGSLVWKWLRTHNDRTLGPPPENARDAHIERLVRRGKDDEALRAICRKYICSPQQARSYLDQIRQRQNAAGKRRANRQGGVGR